MPFGSAPGPGYRRDPSAASTNPRSNLIELGTGDGDQFAERARPIKQLNLEAQALMAAGKREEAANKYIAAARLCAQAASEFSGQYRPAFVNKEAEYKALADEALTPTNTGSAASPPAASRSASAPAPSAPPPGAKKPSPIGLPAPQVKRPATRFREYESAPNNSCTDYIKGLYKQAEAVKEQNPAKAIELFTEASELLWWWSVNRNTLVPDVQEQFRAWAQRYDAEVLRLRGGSAPSAAAVTANGTGTANTDLAEIERRARDCIVDDSPDKAVTWDDVVGCEAAKNALMNRLIDPYVLEDGEKQKKGSGVLLYGPSGTGKTMLVKAVVNLVQELRAEGATDETPAAEPAAVREGAPVDGDAKAKKDGITLIVASMADVNSKWVGEGEKFVRALFDVARRESPSVIFIDEVDALLAQRTEGQNSASRSVLNEFLIQSNDLNKDGADVTLLMATNVPWLLDDAIRRRISSQVEVPLPDPATRATILKQKLKKLDYPCAATEQEIEALATSREMHNFSGSNLEVVVTQARASGPDRRRHEATAFVWRDEMWWPCEKGTLGSKEGNYLQILRDHKRDRHPSRIAFAKEPITLEDLRQASRGVPTADKQIKEFEKYRRDVEAARQ